MLAAAHNIDVEDRDVMIEVLKGFAATATRVGNLGQSSRRPSNWFCQSVSIAQKPAPEMLQGRPLLPFPQRG